jgi:hypothetical protein
LSRRDGEIRSRKPLTTVVNETAYGTCRIIALREPQGRLLCDVQRCPPNSPVAVKERGEAVTAKRQGWAMKHTLYMTLAVALAIVGCSGFSSPVKVEGEVVSVSIETGQPVIGNLNKPEMNASVKGSLSSVNIELKNVESTEYKIPLPQLIAMQGFADLKGKSESMGGLLILSDIQKRLTGKHVVMTCTKAGKEDDIQAYTISELQIKE